jgi:preprotein translocase subunit SecF
METLNLTRKGIFWVSLILIPLSYLFLQTKPLDIGIEFSGGIQKEYHTTTIIQDIKNKIIKKAQESNEDIVFLENGVLVKTTPIQDGNVEKILKDNNVKYNLVTSHTIEPKMGEEYILNNIIGVILGLISIMFYVGIRFNFFFGFSIVLGLCFDFLVMLECIKILHFEINGTMVVAILTILAYSVNDSLILFEKIRDGVENTKVTKMGEIIDKSILLNTKRTIFTSSTTILTTILLGFFTNDIIQMFGIVLSIGVITGVISSLFISTTFLEMFFKWNLEQYREKLLMEKRIIEIKKRRRAKYHKKGRIESSPLFND